MSPRKDWAGLRKLVDHRCPRCGKLSKRYAYTTKETRYPIRKYCPGCKTTVDALHLSD